MKYPIGIQDFRELRSGYSFSKDKLAVGINFSSEERKITGWLLEEMVGEWWSNVYN